MTPSPELSRPAHGEAPFLTAPAPHHLNGGHAQPVQPMKRSTFSFGKIAGIAIGLAVLGGGAFYYFNGMPGAKPVAAVPPPYPVGVQTVAARKIRIWNEFSGRLHAVDFAEIRPEVVGRITEVLFEDGQDVKAGDVLFVIDPRPYEAAVAKAEAAVATATAQQRLAKADQERSAALIGTHAIAQHEFDQTDNASRVADSNLQAAQAELKSAQVDFDHAYVKAPISGRVSRAEITVGNLVQSGPGAPLLTSIVSEDGIYADFEVDEQTYLETIRSSANGNAQEKMIPVQLIAQGDREHVYNGFIQSFDNRIDATSGTIRARAKFENADRTLVPGMFVSVRLASSRERDALLVPERAIGDDQSKKFVYVVDAANHVGYRQVELGKTVGEQRVIESGVAPGDRIVVDGVQHVRPNSTVDAHEVAAPASGTAVADNAAAQNPAR